MRSILLAAIFTLGAAASAAEVEVQGLYEGKQGSGKIEARVVALGHDSYKMYIRRPGKVVEKAELDGKTEGGAVTFVGSAGDWNARYDAGAIAGTGPKGVSLHVTRVTRKPPALGKAPPRGAVVLLDGKDFSRLTKKGEGEAWAPGPDGSVQVPKGGMTSAPTIDGSFDMHVEFQCPFMPAARGQHRGNSGCYLPNGDEIQVLDSFGTDTYTGGGCGGLYKYKDPDAFDVFSLASLPPLEWQTYDIQYRVVKKEGQPTGKPHVTVHHNGIKIHDNAELKLDAKSGTLHFQDHGNPVRYRNIWLVPVHSSSPSARAGKTPGSGH